MASSPYTFSSSVHAGVTGGTASAIRLIGLLAGLLITHLLIFDLVLHLMNAERATDSLSYAESAKSIDGPTLWVGRTRTALLLVLVSAVALVRLRMLKDATYPRSLAIAFAIYWFGSLVTPALSAAEFNRVYAYLYPLFTGLAIASIPSGGWHAFRSLFSWTIVVATIASLVAFAFVPKFVSEIDYEGGLFGAFPRFQGFSVHANGLGAILAPWLLLLARWPLRPRSINAIAWIAGLLALVASQSKTSIAATLLAGVWMSVASRDESRRRLLVSILPPLALGCIGALFLAVSLDLVPSLSRDAFKSVTTLTGRSLIWSLALDAWQSHPWFGYGPSLFQDGAFDSHPEMGGTVHAHNQILDTLGRSGLFGLCSLLVLLIALVVGVIRLSDRDRSLGVALFLTLTIQSMSETPLALGNGAMNVSFWMLMALIASRSTR